MQIEFHGKAGTLKKRLGIICVFSLFFSGCSVGPDYVPPYIEVTDSWKKEESCREAPCVDESLTYLDYWWEVFEDDKLNELEALACQNNRNLYIAYERIQEARGLMGVAAADFYPQITLNPFFSNTNQLAKTYGGSDIPTPIRDQVFREHQVLYLLPINLSYEVDLWGKIRDGYNAARYNWEAVQKDYDGVMLSLTSALATTYYQLRTADKQLDLLTYVIQTRQKAYQINKDRNDEEITNYADVTLAAQQLDTAIVTYQEIQRQRDLLENEIAVLVGVPASEFCLEHLPLQSFPPCIPAGIPSEVLLRRPDIAEALYTTYSSHALVKEAYANLFPSVVLTGSVGYESPLLKYFLKSLSRYYSNSTAVDQLIFDGGRTTSQIDVQISRFLQTSGEYQQTVLVAFEEVENSLSNVASYDTQYKTASQRVDWATKTYQLYLDRYKAGIAYYIDVANTERDLLDYQIDRNALQGLQFLATIELIRALGGCW